MGSNNHTIDNNWSFDIGATHHTTFDQLTLSNYNQLESKMDIWLGDNNRQYVVGIGNLAFPITQYIMYLVL